jgi:hypothetical protein
MKKTLNISDELLFNSLKVQRGSGVIIFKGVRRQRGGGFGSVLLSIARYAIPVIKKYLLPHAKQAVSNIISDVERGESIKTAVKRNAKQAIRTAGAHLVKSSVLQTGEGIRSRSNPRKRKAEKNKISVSSKKSKKNNSLCKTKAILKGIKSIF